MRRRTGVWGTAALLAACLLLNGCALSSDATVPDSTPIPTPSVTPTTTPPPPPPSPNDLGADRVAQIATVECPGTVSEDTVRMLVQHKADAVSFFASTQQCGDIPQVLAAGDDVRPFVSPLQYIDAACTAGTLLTVWAHYDDDLVFGSPTIPEALDAGRCVRNLYLTGSDAGRGLDYALGREDGLRDAYDLMLGAPHEWEQRTVALVDGLTVTMSRPIGDPRVSLIFLRLPDGGLDAEGFDVTGRTSLPQLLAGKISTLAMIDTGTPVALDDISSTVVEVYDAYLPESVLAHLPGRAKGTRGDHPDHQVTGDIVMGTVDSGFLDPDRVVYAQGYGSEEREQNLDGETLQRKLEIFVTYATHDPATKCETIEKCMKTQRFSKWLVRQYLIPHTDIVRP